MTPSMVLPHKRLKVRKLSASRRKATTLVTKHRKSSYGNRWQTMARVPGPPYFGSRHIMQAISSTFIKHHTKLITA